MGADNYHHTVAGGPQKARSLQHTCMHVHTHTHTNVRTHDNTCASADLVEIQGSDVDEDVLCAERDACVVACRGGETRDTDRLADSYDAGLLDHGAQN